MTWKSLLLLIFKANEVKASQPSLSRSETATGLTVLCYQKALNLWNQTAVMVEVWWFALGAAVPCVVAAGRALNTKQGKAEEEEAEERLKKSARAVGMETNGGFVCERVCISKRLENKVGGGGAGGLYKDPSVVVNSCVTVCGCGEVDTCLDACTRTVCAHQHHQLPDWNELCLRRCQSECLKLSSKSSVDSL